MYQFHQEQHSYALLAAQEKKLKAARSWVMTSPNGDGFVKLPNERILHKSPPRTSLEVSSQNQYPGTQPFSTKSDAGVIYLTNQRVVYLPANPTAELQSFSSPILNLQDTYVRAPFFGANYWTASCKPVAGGGIPSQNPAVELRCTFKEGGAFDFHTIFEQIKERAHQAYEVARETGLQGNSDVNLEQLPAYEAASEIENNEPAILSPIPVRPIDNLSASRESSPRNPPTNAPGPDEPPPGYEEAQAQAVTIDLDQRLRDEAISQ